MLNQSGVLENTNGDSHSRPAHTEHLREKYLRELEFAAARAVL
jgi:hypothetical protein